MAIREANMNKLKEIRTFFNDLASDYDQIIADKADADIESKQLVAPFLPKHTKNLIDFGIGTGMELEAIFARFPDIDVTGLDIAENMLKLLEERYADKNLRLLCESYLDYDFGSEQYDAALSIKTLHHYNHDVKTNLYKKIHQCLKPNGVYIECDKMVLEQAEEDFYFTEYERLKLEQSVNDDQVYHYDTPCTLENQTKMLLAAGFSSVTEVWRKESGQGLIVILLAAK